MAVKTIEDCAAVGFDHLIDKTLVEKRKGLNCCLGVCCKLLLFLVCVAMIVFTTLYWIKRTSVEDQYSDGNRDTVVDDSVVDAPDGGSN